MLWIHFCFAQLQTTTDYNYDTLYGVNNINVFSLWLLTCMTSEQVRIESETNITSRHCATIVLIILHRPGSSSTSLVSVYKVAIANMLAAQRTDREVALCVTFSSISANPIRLCWTTMLQKWILLQRKAIHSKPWMLHTCSNRQHRRALQLAQFPGGHQRLASPIQ